MISAKIEVDSILKSNKLVILLNESSNNKQPGHNQPTTINRSESEDYPYLKKVNLINHRLNNNYNNKVNKIPLKQQIKTDHNTPSTNHIIKLLELYGIHKKHITIVSINQLKNSKISELYLKSYYCNNQEVKVMKLFFLYPELKFY